MSTGIDIGNAVVKVISLERSLGGRFQLQAAAHLARKFITEDESAADEQVINILKQVFYTIPLLRKKCILGVSGREVNLRITQVPPVTHPAKFKKLMEYEIMQIAGKSGGDVYSDYCILNVPGRGYPELPVLVGLVKNSLVDNRVKILRKTGGQLFDVTPNSLALFLVLRINPEINLSETIMALDIGQDNTELIIQKDGCLIFARNITSGGRVFTESLRQQLKIDLAQAELLKIKDGLISSDRSDDNPISRALISATSPLLSLVESSVSFVRGALKIEQLEIDRVLLSGGGARVKGLDQYLQSALNKPVGFLQPFKNIKLNPALDGTLVQRLTEVPSDLTIALGLALTAYSAPETTLSFNPPAIKKEKDFRRKQIPLIAAAILFLLTLIILAVKSSMVWRAEQQSLNELKNDYGQINTLAEQFNREAAQRDKTLNSYQQLMGELEPGYFYYQALGLINQFLPDGVWVSEISMGRSYPKLNPFESQHEKRVVVVRGYLESSDEATTQRLNDFVAEFNKNTKLQGQAQIQSGQAQIQSGQATLVK
ncbi:MAG: pilus assembly protein PilM, partial [Planctomycetota bacterium]